MIPNTVMYSFNDFTYTYCIPQKDTDHRDSLKCFTGPQGPGP